MLHAAWKSLLGRKLRLLLSALAIVLGISFVSGSFIFTNLLGASFSGMINGTVADVNVALKGTYDQSLGGLVNDKAEITPEQLDAIRRVDGVASVTGLVSVFNAYPMGKDNKLISIGGAPGVASNWFTEPAAGGFPGITLKSGHEPRTDDEVVLDPGSLATSGYQVGDEIKISTQTAGTITKTIVGTAEWGNGGTAGAAYTFFTTAETQRLFTEGRDIYLVAWVVAERGTDVGDLAERIGQTLPDTLEAVTGDAAAEQTKSTLEEGLGFINTFLLVFAAIALVVASFIIVNTFNILVAQRSRELALLRALGAKRHQVAGSVLFEALIVGLVGSTLGLLGGWGLAWAIRGVFGQLGIGFGAVAPTLTPAAIISSYGVGIAVTLLAAWLPARKASQVTPVAAMTGDLGGATSTSSVASMVGIGAIELGVAGIICGLWFSVPQPLWWLGVGAFLVVVGVAMSSPVVGRPVIWAVGALSRKLFGETGRLAQLNAIRQPRRTASTASALMIGLTLVTTVAVLGASASATITASVNESLRGDFQVASVNYQPFSTTIGDKIEQTDGVATVHRLRIGAAQIGEEPVRIVGMDGNSFDKVIEQTLVKGTLMTGDGDAILSQNYARDHALVVGDSVDVNTPTAKRSFRVSGIFVPGAGMEASAGSVVIDLAALDALTRPLDYRLSIDLKPTADSGAVRSEIDRLTADEPTVVVTNSAEWAERQTERVGTLLNVLYALLGLAVIIAILGIVNTLALAVLERTRELGLLRAVGFKRGQIRLMVTLESVIIALLGSFLGVGLGLVFGVALQSALADDGLSHLGVPWGQIVVFLIVSAVVGVLAALWPANRAARLDVLRAISTD